MLGEELGGESAGFGDLDGAERSGVAVDHLRVQQRPRRVEGG
ncbi:hypothetical protein [Microbacterium sp. Se63.02b]|nr:hypothetical protein [Microbacterium sp. Se63.02b]